MLDVYDPVQDGILETKRFLQRHLDVFEIYDKYNDKRFNDNSIGIEQFSIPKRINDLRRRCWARASPFPLKAARKLQGPP